MLAIWDFFSSIPAPVWAVLSGGLSGLGSWIVGLRKISASIERARLKTSAEALTDENAERAAFRAALLADISELRQKNKECEADRDLLRTRLNSTEEQILVLKASNQIMERWLSFFRDRSALEVRVPSESIHPDAVSGAPSRFTTSVQ